MACNLSSPFVKDGVGRLLAKSDIEKLKAENQMAEKAITINWKLCQLLSRTAGHHVS